MSNGFGGGEEEEEDTWDSSERDPTQQRYTDAFVSNRNIRMKGDYKYKHDSDVEQPLFSMGIPGVPSLHQRTTAYSSSI